MFKSSYTIKTDGTVWAPGSSRPVTTADMPYVLEKLVRNQRLKALLTLNLILNRSKGEKKLTPEEVHSGTFTITNPGNFGAQFGLPIINQPQVAILGTGVIKKRVVVIDDAIAIRSMAYFTMSFDHRIVDGALGGMFLEEVVQTLQNFDINLKF
jgi:2-oxoglutarate dehydrogenase E2 component (dihydrolipoamide succinyltransferase)